MHAAGVLEPAQILRLALNDTLRLLLVVWPSRKYLASIKLRVAPSHIYAGINAHVLKKVAPATRSVVVKHRIIGIHHNVGIVENIGRDGGWGAGCGGVYKQVRIQRLIGCYVHGGISLYCEILLRVIVVGDCEIAVIHVAGAGLKGSGQIAGRRRRKQVLALGHLQQVGVAGSAHHCGGRGLHAAHVFGAVPFCQNAAIPR